MKKKYLILFALILLLVVLSIFITFEIINMNNKNKFQKSTVNIYSINKEKEKEKKEKEKAENKKAEEQKKLWENGEELYITINDKVITCYKNKQDWIFENRTPDYIKSYFNKLWNELQIETLYFTKDERALITLQLSRYGYPYDDLDFTIHETLMYRENGTYSVMFSKPFHYKNENKNKILSINTANKGKSILGYKIQVEGGKNYTFEKYYLYKIDVQ